MFPGMEKATFGAGCFWGVEAAFQEVEGVVSTAVGYSGGSLRNPTYEDVCSGRTGHAEVVQIEYDPDPPFDSGSPKTASPELLATVRSRLTALNEQRREVARRVGQKLGVPQRP